MSYADPQEFGFQIGRDLDDDRNGSSSASNGSSLNKPQNIYAIPGYIAYAIARHDDTYSHPHHQDNSAISFKGVGVELDNPAFHHHEQNRKLPTPFSPCCETELSKNVNLNCNHHHHHHHHHNNVLLRPYANTSTSSADSMLEKSSCCRKWTLHLMPSEKNRKCAILSVLILAIVLLVAALVVVLFLTVGGGMELFNSSKNESSERGSMIVDGTFRISSVAYDDDLANSATKLYNILRLEVSHAVFILFNKSSIAQYYNRSEVLQFRNGSVVVDVRVFLTTPLEDVAAKVTSAFVKGLVNMHGTVLMDKFVVDIRSISFHVPTDATKVEQLATSYGTDSLKSLQQTPPPPPPPPSSSGPASTANAPAVIQQDAGWQPPRTTESAPSSSAASPSTTERTSGHPRPGAVDIEIRTSSPSAVVVVTFPSLSGATVRKDDQPANRTAPQDSPAVVSSPSSVPFRPLVVPQPPPPPPPDPQLPSSTRNPYAHRPAHPFLRPPPAFNMPTLSSSHHTRPIFSPHLHMDFEDSPGWAAWSQWSPCGNGLCVANKNNTQTRTRECRTRNGTGEVLTDIRECLKRGGARFEKKGCTCDKNSSAPRHFFPFLMSTVSLVTQTPGRPCEECTSSEICLARHTEKDAICRIPKDLKDETGCGGWCDAAFEYCQHVPSGSKRCIDDRVCLPNEWQCGNGLCVPSDKRCDGHFNCYDTTDELNCKCDENHFRCGKNTSCLPKSKKCDHIIDCWDGSDEENCTKQCPNSEFTCNSGQCIPSMYFCDGLIDCQDGSDEPEGCNGTACLASEFRCANGRCIKGALRCDGADACGDASDEHDCANITASGRTASDSRKLQQPARRSVDDRRDGEERCSGIGTFACRDGNDCVDRKLVCDGHFDCEDLSDERGCSAKTSATNCSLPAVYRCDDSPICIPANMICDRKYDCPGRDDEKDCIQRSASTDLGGTTGDDCAARGDFRCANGRCLARHLVCDSVDNCGDSSDESGSSCVRH